MTALDLDRGDCRLGPRHGRNGRRLGPTVEALQSSALDLVRRMCEVGR